MSLARLLFLFTVLALSSGPVLALERDVLYDFEIGDGEVPAGWVIPALRGNWGVDAGELAIGPNAGSESWIWLDRAFAGDITIEFDINFPGKPADGVGRHGGISFFSNFPNKVFGTRYDGMTGYTMDWIDRTGDHGIRFHKWVNGAELGLLQDNLFTDADPPQHWKIEIKGDIISLTLDDVPFQDINDNSLPRSGYIGFWVWQNNVNTHFDNLHVINPDLVVYRDIPDDLRN